MDRVQASDREHQERLERQLADYQEQAGKPFEHEQKLRELLARQATLNAALDLDKGERNQVTDDDKTEDPDKGTWQQRVEESPIECSPTL